MSTIEIIACGCCFAGIGLLLWMIAWSLRQELPRFDYHEELPEKIDCLDCRDVGWFFEDRWVACPTCNWEGDKPKPKQRERSKHE